MLSRYDQNYCNCQWNYFQVFFCKTNKNDLWHFFEVIWKQYFSSCSNVIAFLRWFRNNTEHEHKSGGTKICARYPKTTVCKSNYKIIKKKVMVRQKHKSLLNKSCLDHVIRLTGEIVTWIEFSEKLSQIKQTQRLLLTLLAFYTFISFYLI